MMRKLAISSTLLALFAMCPAALPQQTTGQPQEQSLGDAARQQRALKEKQARDAANPANGPASGSKTVADVAHEEQEKKLKEVRTSLEDSRKLFASIDEVVNFVSQDSGLPKRVPVRHQLIGENEVVRQMKQNLSSSETAQRMARSELVLKKFGLLPNNFDLKTFLLGSSPKGLGAYYDPRTKMVNLLNWIEISEQLPILAHELTHALQDQNYDLMKWRGVNPDRPLPPAKMRVDGQDEQEGLARTAIVEGQAEIVRYDYMLKSSGTSLLDTPELLDSLQDAATRTYNDVVVVHSAPLLLKETGFFPYREGLSFELELLRTGGKQMAFAGAFTRPPLNTHEVLEPKAYIAAQKPPAALMPDLTALLAPRYEAFDSGIIGELDVRVMARQFGREDDAFSLPPNWNGGAYVAVKQATAKAALPAGDKPAQMATDAKPAQPSSGNPVQATAEGKPAQPAGENPAQPVAEKQPPISSRDLSLLYLSRWKTLEAAMRFVKIYESSLGKRVTVFESKNLNTPECPTDSPTCGPIWAKRFATDDGPIVMEIWPRNLVFITHSFDDATVARLRQAVLAYPAGGKPTTSTAELSLRLLELPEFQGFEQEIGREISSSFASQLASTSK
jgi:hypothetical protein